MCVNENVALVGPHTQPLLQFSLSQNIIIMSYFFFKIKIIRLPTNKYYLSKIRKQQDPTKEKGKSTEKFQWKMLHLHKQNIICLNLLLMLLTVYYSENTTLIHYKPYYFLIIFKMLDCILFVQDISLKY